MIKNILIVISLLLSTLEASKPPALVNTTKVIKGVINPLEEFVGTLNFSKTSKVASSTNGLVTNVYFQTGDKVLKGDKLLEIDSLILDNQISSAIANIKIAQINLENATKDYNRYRDLIKKDSVSQQLYDDSTLQYKLSKQNLLIAKNKLEELKVEKQYKTIIAPFDGVIVEKTIEEGEWSSIGKTVATLVSTNEIDLIFNLPTSYIYKLDKNDKYNIKLKDKIIKSKLYATIAKGDRRTRTFPVKFKAKVDNQFLYDGMEVKIDLPREKKQEALMVPRDCVIKRFGQNVIFLNVEGIATMMPVEIIGYTKQSVAIKSIGLKEGATVVVKGNERIFPKQPIKSLNKE